jgi:membrane protease YdiL (CAAX protease family)
MNGKGAPARTAAWRRTNLRALPVSEDVWASALLAGVAGIALSLVALNIANRLTGSQYVPLPTPMQLPPIQTALGLNFMGAAIAGVAEEGAFRGFMQVPIERRFGPVIAIGVSAIVFWLAHLTRAGTISIAPFYLTYGIVFGSLAYFSRSIYPGMTLHAGGDALAGLGALARPVAQVEAPSPVPVVDFTFLIVLVAFVVLTVVAIVAFRSLARAADCRTSES